MVDLSRTLTVLTIALMLAGIFASMPGATAQVPGSAGVVSFYLDQSTLTTTAPTSTTSQKRALIPTASTPAATVNPSEVEWSGYKMPTAVKFTGEGTISFFLTAKDATAPAFWNNMRAIVKKDATIVGQLSRGVYLDSNTAAGTSAGPLGNNVLSPGEVLRVDFAVPLQGVEFKAGDELRVALILWGVGHPSTPVEAAALFGSVAHASRLTVGVDSPGPLPIVGGEKKLYLEDSALSPTEPTAAASKKRVTGSTGQGVAPAAAAAASEFSWGKFKTDSEIVLTSDSYLRFWVTWDGPAGFSRGLRGFLYIDGVQVAFNDIGLSPTAYPTPPATTVQTIPVLFGFGTAGKTIPAGKEVEVRFITWAASGAPPGNFVFLYGSAAHPSHLTLRTEGGASSGGGIADLLVGLTSEVSTIYAEAGDERTIPLLITNEGGAPAEVTLNATGDLNATFSADKVTVAAGNFSTVNVTFTVPEGAQEGDSLGLTIHGAVAGAEVSSVSFSIEVVAEGTAPSPSTSPSGSSSPSATTTSSQATTDNGTGQLKTQEAGEPVPGPLGVLVLVGLAAVALMRRRKA